MGKKKKPIVINNEERYKIEKIKRESSVMIFDDGVEVRDPEKIDLIFNPLKITNKKGKENKNFPPIVNIAARIKDK